MQTFPELNIDLIVCHIKMLWTTLVILDFFLNEQISFTQKLLGKVAMAKNLQAFKYGSDNLISIICYQIKDLETFLQHPKINSGCCWTALIS